MARTLPRGMIAVTCDPVAPLSTPTLEPSHQIEGLLHEVVQIRVRTLGEIANRCAHHHNFPIRLQGQGLAIFVVAKITGTTRSRPPIFTGILFLLGI